MRLLTSAVTSAAKATLGFVVIFLVRALTKDSPETPSADAPVSREPTLAPLSPDTKYENTVWIPRILWALEYARINQNEPVTAAGLAHILREQCQLDVRPNNMARAFRQLSEKQIADGLWDANEKAYRISPKGREVLAGLA